MGTRCQKCGGYVVREFYAGPQGKCEYDKCVMCGDCVYPDVTEEEIDSDPNIVQDTKMTYREIGKVLGVSFQMVGKISERAYRKIKKLTGDGYLMKEQ